MSNEPYQGVADRGLDEEFPPLFEPAVSNDTFNLDMTTTFGDMGGAMLQVINNAFNKTVLVMAGGMVREMTRANLFRAAVGGRDMDFFLVAASSAEGWLVWLHVCIFLAQHADVVTSTLTTNAITLELCRKGTDLLLTYQFVLLVHASPAAVVNSFDMTQSMVAWDGWTVLGNTLFQLTLESGFGFLMGVASLHWIRLLKYRKRGLHTVLPLTAAWSWLKMAGPREARPVRSGSGGTVLLARGPGTQAMSMALMRLVMETNTANINVSELGSAAAVARIEQQMAVQGLVRGAVLPLPCQLYVGYRRPSLQAAA
uniref:Uncharacterized protein n=1 Tax=Tetradesmus obliquus TaxID=3088 RepID=A0A383WQ47_TETOB|eukprot:jgi/Sobl393_1/7322/SZX70547.1